VYHENDNNEWVEDCEWIGIVHDQDVKSKVVLITPLAFYDQDGIWQAVSEKDCNQYFPNNGKVASFIWDFPRQKVNQLCCFQPERDLQVPTSDNTGYSDPRYSLYLTRSELHFAPLAQIFDWSCQVKESFDLPVLLEEGINAKDCVSQNIYVRYQYHLYGPILLERDPGNVQILKPQKYFYGSSTGGQPLSLSIYSFHEDKVVTLGPKSFVDRNSLGSPVGNADWSLPQVVMKRVLRASNKSLDLQEHVHLVDRRVSELAALSSSLGPQALQLEMSTIERAQYIVHHQIERLQNLSELMKELPVEHPLFQAALAHEIQKRRGEIEGEATKQCETELNRFQELRTQIRSAQNTLSELRKEIDQAQQIQEQIEADFSTLERSMQERLAELRKEPLHLLADLQLATALPSSLLQPLFGTLGNGAKSTAISSSYRQLQFFSKQAIQTLETTTANLSDLPWIKAAAPGEVTSKDVKICAAALLAGLVPAPSGPTALPLFQTIAQVLTQGRIWSVPVPLTALSPLDLFGTIVADQRRFLPAAGGLADILLEAYAYPEQLAIVLLEGIDRVPALPISVPLLQQYRKTRQKVQLGETSMLRIMPLSLFHPHVLAADDPYQKLASFIWPENLLLGVTFDNDTSSLPLPEVYTSWFVPMHTKPKKPGHGNQGCWQVPPEQWYTWEKRIHNSVCKKTDQEWPEYLDQWQLQFCQAMTDLGIDNVEDKIERIWPQ
jgi:hypothetical protein